VPAEWKILNSWDMPVYSSGNGGMGMTFDSYPIVQENNGNMYLLAINALNWTDIDIAKNISEKNIGTDIYYLSPVIPSIRKSTKAMKISNDGIVAWEYPFSINLSTWDIGGLVRPEYYTMEKPIAISVHGDRVYVYHDFTVDVLDAGGNRLFSIPNASAPAAVDDSGRIYIVQAVHPSREQVNLSIMGTYLNNCSVSVGWDASMISHDSTYMLTNGTVEAYDSDGKFLWSRDIGTNATRPFVEKEAWSNYNTLPLYSDNRLFVPIDDGVITLDLDGQINKTIHLSDGVYTLFPLMPLDSHGTIYMMKLDPVQQLSYITMISPDGRVSRTNSLYDEFAYYENSLSGLVPAGSDDGTVYAYESSATNPGTNIYTGNFDEALASKRFGADTIHANYLASGSEVWNFTIPKRDVRVVTLNADNVGSAVRGTTILYPQDYNAAPLFPSSMGEIRVFPGQNVTYLNYYYTIYEAPIVPNRSRCIYSRGIYAIGNHGNLLWEKDPNGFVSNMAVGNSTIYYSMDNGRIGGTTLNIAAGAIIATFAYLFIRFFAVGTVTRARSRIDKNENRNGVLQYIGDNPGSTLRDIARGAGVNLGTVRYHVFILSLNHRIVSYAADDKHVRYFTNSGVYSKDEQLVISLMRRDRMGRILTLLKEKPGLTNIEISTALGIQESAVSRCMKELSEKGIVSRPSGELKYSIKNDYVNAVSWASCL
jgi:predicted transcriptional regulator